MRSGLIFAAHSPGGRRDLERRTQYWQQRGAPVEMLEGMRCAEAIGSLALSGGIARSRGGNINPFAYARGLAHAAAKAGAMLHARTPRARAGAARRTLGDRRRQRRHDRGQRGDRHQRLYRRSLARTARKHHPDARPRLRHRAAVRQCAPHDPAGTPVAHRHAAALFRRAHAARRPAARQRARAELRRRTARPTGAASMHASGGCSRNSARCGGSRRGAAGWR